MVYTYILLLLSRSYSVLISIGKKGVTASLALSPPHLDWKFDISSKRFSSPYKVDTEDSPIQLHYLSIQIDK